MRIRWTRILLSVSLLVLALELGPSHAAPLCSKNLIYSNGSLISPNGLLKVTPLANICVNSASGSKGTMTFNVTSLEPAQGQYRFTVVTSGAANITFQGIQPLGIDTQGTPTYGNKAELISYVSGISDNLCLDYIGGVCGKPPGSGGGGGGGGGSGGSQTIGIPVSMIFLGQNIGWLISVLTVYSTLVIFAGLVVARRRRR